MVDSFQAIYPPVSSHIVLPLPAGLRHRERTGIKRTCKNLTSVFSLVSKSIRENKRSLEWLSFMVLTFENISGSLGFGFWKLYHLHLHMHMK